MSVDSYSSICEVGMVGSGSDGLVWFGLVVGRGGDGKSPICLLTL